MSALQAPYRSRSGGPAARHSGNPSVRRRARRPVRFSSSTARSAYTQYGPRQYGDVFLALREAVCSRRFSSSTGTEIAPGMCPAMYLVGGPVSRITTSFDRARLSSSAIGTASASARSPKCSWTSRSSSARRPSATVRRTFDSSKTSGPRKPVVHEQAVFPAVDQSRLAKRLQMLRGVGQREADFGRQGVHGALALSEQFRGSPGGAGSRAPYRSARIGRRDGP